MEKLTSAAYGTWQSPITPDLIVKEAVRFGDIVIDRNTVYWLEQRPSDGGRGVIVRRSPVEPHQHSDITPAGYSVMSRVHEYGGGAFTAHQDTVYFVNFSDQGLYYQTGGAMPQPLVVTPKKRFADLLIDSTRRQLLCVCEDHDQPDEPVNSLIAVDLSDAAAQPRSIAQGADFYASPALSPDGKRLAWLSWNHPNMPWDGTELWLADRTDDGGCGPARCIAGGHNESIFQPQWGPDGALYFISDRSGWWNLYRWDAGGARGLLPMEAEFGLPQWVFSQSTYGFDAKGGIICAYNQRGVWRLGRLTDQGGLEQLDIPYTQIAEISCCGDRLVFQAGSPDQETAIVEMHLDQGNLITLRHSSIVTIEPGYISVPEPIEFPTAQARSAHAFFYPPTNKDYQAPVDERPPLLVKSHGGPTSATTATLNLGIQYWTSRGFAVLDVNYGGSTGYGRAYRQRLDGQWGVVDVQDCIAATAYLIEQGRIDGTRCAIRGGSAGGYTTLAALTFHDLFKAGASYYGIGDLEALAKDTHKFESRYLDRLVGPYPETRNRYRARSPINHIERLSAPVIFFQGLEDKVVPPNQAERMVAALRAKGIAVAYVAFADEHHGFRKAENIKRTLEAELYFYARIFGFALTQRVEPVVIENLS